MYSEGLCISQASPEETVKRIYTGIWKEIYYEVLVCAVKAAMKPQDVLPESRKPRKTSEVFADQAQSPQNQGSQ